MDLVGSASVYKVICGRIHTHSVKVFQAAVAGSYVWIVRRYVGFYNEQQHSHGSSGFSEKFGAMRDALEYWNMMISEKGYSSDIPALVLLAAEAGDG